VNRFDSERVIELTGGLVSWGEKKHKNEGEKRRSQKQKWGHHAMPHKAKRPSTMRKRSERGWWAVIAMNSMGKKYTWD